MKMFTLLMMVSTVASSAAFGQARPVPEGDIEAHIMALERAGWDAWKNKDRGWFEANTMKDILWISADGITDKVQYLKNLPAGCEIKHVSLADFRFGVKTSDSIVMTYTATQDGTCGGKQLPSTVRASVVYTKGGGKWREALYVETPITP